MKLNEYLKIIENFIKEYLMQTGMSGYVLGLSGGVDSSLVALLTKSAVGNEKLKVVIIPIDSNSNDLKDAMLIVEKFNLNHIVIDGSDIFHLMEEKMQQSNIVLDQATKSNLKARIRMSILYAIAQINHALVIGTDNKDERYTGYFTKYGDGAVDLLPIAHLVKNEVVEAAKLYGLPASLAERTPSAGLFDGQTDENEMGVLYRDLDAYLLDKPIDQNVITRIEHLHKISEHKRKDIPMPSDFKRD